jgi:excisionase family DNA binding protein
MSNDARVPRLLTIREVANVTNVQRWRWYDLISRGKGPRVVRVGRTLRVSEAELLRWSARERNSNSATEPEPFALSARGFGAFLLAEPDREPYLSAVPAEVTPWPTSWTASGLRGRPLHRRASTHR